MSLEDHERKYVADPKTNMSAQLWIYYNLIAYPAMNREH